MMASPLAPEMSAKTAKANTAETTWRRILPPLMPKAATPASHVADLCTGDQEGGLRSRHLRLLRNIACFPAGIKRIDLPFLKIAEQGEDIAPPHSMTSSASASTAGGTSRPNSFATLRLMTKSTLVGACAGSSAGLAPF